MKRKENRSKRKRSANRHLSEQYVYTGENNTPTGLLLLQYGKDDVQSSEIIYNSGTSKSLKEKDAINWLQVSGLTDSELITRIATDFEFNALDAKDILTPQHVVKAEEYHGKIFMVLNACRYDEFNNIHTEHIGILMAGNTIITFTENNHDLFAPVLKAIQDDILDIRSKNDSSLLLAFLLNAIVVCLIETSSRVEEYLEDIEDMLLDITTDQRNVGSLIQQRRREYIIIRKNSQPLREQIGKLIKEDNLISRDAQPAFSDLTDQLMFINQTIEGCREIISSLVDLYISNNDLRMNAIMKRLTVVSTLFIPLTFLAGIWGMNFTNMPELGWRYGYIVAWGVMLATGIGTWLYMRKKDWY